MLAITSFMLGSSDLEEVQQDRPFVLSQQADTGGDGKYKPVAQLDKMNTLLLSYIEVSKDNTEKLAEFSGWGSDLAEKYKQLSEKISTFMDRIDERVSKLEGLLKGTKEGKVEPPGKTERAKKRDRVPSPQLLGKSPSKKARREEKDKEEEESEEIDDDESEDDKLKVYNIESESDRSESDEEYKSKYNKTAQKTPPKKEQANKSPPTGTNTNSTKKGK